MSQLLDARNAYDEERAELQTIAPFRLRWRFRQLRRQAEGSSDPATLARLAAARHELLARGADVPT